MLPFTDDCQQARLKRSGQDCYVLNVAKSLAQLLQAVDPIVVRGPTDLVVRGIAMDSRRVEPGFLFAAFPGLHTDGHRYITQALQKGAAAILHSRPCEWTSKSAAFIEVRDSRLSFSALAAAYYGYPAESLVVFGVTGTDGKSTTVWFIRQLAELTGHRTGFFSSVDIDTGQGPEPNPHHTSTPEAPEVHHLLARMRDSGLECGVVEATSHGLSHRTGRLAHVRFDAAVFTNVAQEHLEFHGTLERYRDDKANLFRQLDGQRAVAVVNRDDPHWELFAAAAASHDVVTYGIQDCSPDLYATRIVQEPTGCRFLVHDQHDEYPAALALPGLYNAQNFLGAAAAVSGRLGVPMGEICDLSHSLSPPRGRHQRIDCGQPFDVFVDFAHTPQSFDSYLSLMRGLTGGRLIVVFGSAGERDVQKRPLQGRVASNLADLVVLTDEDPRGEDPMGIIEEIAAGCIGPATVERIPDRRKALSMALGAAGPGDTVLCLGKGHENSIQYADGAFPWDEAAEVTEILRSGSYSSHSPGP
jgi:UDP-N-acetylmuramoyl-L-alanyl-D-glutamate--2,6-diaminopimelate ligase